MNGSGPIPCCYCGRTASIISLNDCFSEPVAHYAYLRVSTPHAGRREPEALRARLLQLSRHCSESSSWRTPPAVGGLGRDREIGRLLETADAGDVLVAAEVSRLARSTLQVLELLQAAAERGVDGAHRQESDGARPIVAGHDHRNDPWARGARSNGNLSRPGRKRRSRAAKQRGLPVGRPKGRATKLMLDDRRAEIVDYFSKGVSKRSVARILGCSPTTLYSWIRRRRISGR